MESCWGGGGRGVLVPRSYMEGAVMGIVTTFDHDHDH